MQLHVVWQTDRPINVSEQPATTLFKAGTGEWVGELINACIIMAGKHAEKHPLGEPRRMWEDNMDGS
jgi:hypothetical protein